MKRNGMILAAVAATAFLVHLKPAGAQVRELVPVQVRAKIGVFLPRGDARSFSGSTHLAAEADVSLRHLSNLTLTAGYYQGSDGGNKLRMIPVTLSKVFSPPNPVAGATGNVYFGAGLGPYFVRTSGGGTSDSKTTLGGFGMAGYQFPNRYFVEAKYHLAGKVNGIRPHGLALMLGRSF